MDLFSCQEPKVFKMYSIKRRGEKSTQRERGRKMLVEK